MNYTYCDYGRNGRDGKGQTPLLNGKAGESRSLSLCFHPPRRLRRQPPSQGAMANSAAPCLSASLEGGGAKRRWVSPRPPSGRNRLGVAKLCPRTVAGRLPQPSACAGSGTRRRAPVADAESVPICHARSDRNRSKHNSFGINHSDRNLATRDFGRTSFCEGPSLVVQSRIWPP